MLRIGDESGWLRRWPRVASELALVALGVFVFVAPVFPAGETSPVSPEDVARAACEFLGAAVTVPHDSVAAAVDLPPLPQAGGGIADFRFELLSAKSPAGAVGLRVTLFFRDGTSRTVQAAARVRVYDRVCVAARRLDRHEGLTQDALRIEHRDVTALADGYYRSGEDLAGKRTRRIIAVGSILEASDVESPPLVERGSGVAISVVIGAVTVVSRGKALEDGELGQVISVEHVVTGRRIAGTVAGKGLVVLEG